MIPNNEDFEYFENEIDDDETFDFEELESEPSLTYGMDTEKNQFIGKTDGIDAIRQAILKIINTERYEYEIYSWNYGIELTDLYGQSIPYVMSEIKQRIEDAVCADNRISEVDNFEIKKIGKRVLHITFIAITIANDEIEIESEVGV